MVLKNIDELIYRRPPFFFVVKAAHSNFYNSTRCDNNIENFYRYIIYSRKKSDHIFHFHILLNTYIIIKKKVSN